MVEVSNMAVEGSLDVSATEVVVLVLTSLAVLLVVTHPGTRDTAFLSIRPEALQIQIFKILLSLSYLIEDLVVVK